MIRILFVCSRNQWRSPTAEAIYQNDPRIEARSAGTAASARRRVSESLLCWADLILVMEGQHKLRIQDQFRDIAHTLRIEVLDISDDYRFMDPELMALIRDSVEPRLENLSR